jgi:hypothetical protein
VVKDLLTAPRIAFLPNRGRPKLTHRDLNLKPVSESRC